MPQWKEQVKKAKKAHRMDVAAMRHHFEQVVIPATNRGKSG